MCSRKRDKFAGYVQSHDEFRWSHCFPCCDEEGDGCVRFSTTLLFSVLTYMPLFNRKKDMSGEEAMVLSHIQASGNEGILLLDHM